MIDGANSSKTQFEYDNDIAVGCGQNGTISMRDVIADLKERKNNVLSGGINCIPFPFERFRSEIPGLEQEQYIVLTASTKAGKCFAKGTRVRMADNTVKNIEDIKIGDYVMSPGAEPPKVVESLGHGTEQMFRISSETHEDLIVNESHIMYLYLPRENRYTTMTVGELFDKQNKYSEYYFRHTIKAVISDECDYRQNPELPVEPYFYGLWLGDGSTSEVDICNPDIEVIDYIKDYAKRIGMRYSSYGYGKRCQRHAIVRNSYKVKSFKDILKEVTLWNKEHINRNYLNASISDRYQLLAGIIDTDGYLNRNKTGYQITMKYLSCIKDIQELARSLGMEAHIRNKWNSKYKKYYYVLCINGINCTKIPVKIARKRCKCTRKDFKHYAFKITPIGTGEYYGLTIGGNHLFLLEDYTIVHNTQMASFLLYNVLDYAFNNPDKCTVHIIYFNLEESQMRIKQRYISYLLYTLDGYRMSPRDLRSTSADFPLPDEVIALLETEKYQKRLDFFDNCVQFETEDTNPTGILRVCEEYAKSVGEYKSYKRKSRGSDREVDVFQSYTPHDKKHYKFVLFDHIGLVDLERGMSLKQSMDKLSEYTVKYIRNRYKYNVIAIQQQSTEAEGLEAIKQKKMVPAVSTLGDTKYTARDANYTLGLFDPSFFGLPSWLGYKIQDVDGSGLKSYGRFLYVLRGRDGESGGVCPLFFDGAVCNFEELPKPDDINGISQYYNRVKNLKSFRQNQKLTSLTSVMCILIKKLKKSK